MRVLILERLYTPEEIAGPVALVLEGSTIHSIWRATTAQEARQRLLAQQVPVSEIEIIDLGSWSVAPGYIDLHIHGFAGHDISTGEREDVESIAQQIPRTGVTSFFPTIATIGRAETVQQVQKVSWVAEHQKEAGSAEILGLRLEGPFINRAKKGAQYEPGIRLPDSTEIELLTAESRSWLRMLDFAPEEDHDQQFLATLVHLGIIPCIGHSAATYEQTLQAIDGGARHSTHLFNAMSALDHRAPGAPGALLTDQRATVEVIADGIHLHPAILKLVIAARSIEKVALITDAISPTGLSEGEYEFVGRKILIRDGAVRLENGALAGSVLTLDRAVRNIIAFTGLSWSAAIRMATLVPATIAGVEERKGRIAPGMDADLVVLDQQGQVRQTWTRGQLAYSSQ